METTTLDPAVGGFFALFGIGLFMAFMIPAILIVICNWIIHEKAGQPGWSSLVPIYNLLVLCKIIGKPYTWLLWLLVPFVGWIVWPIQAYVGLARSFGKDVGFALGLFFLSPIFYAILAFDKSIRYVGPGGNAASLDAQIGSIGKPAF